MVLTASGRTADTADLGYRPVREREGVDAPSVVVLEDDLGVVDPLVASGIGTNAPG